jgi:Zn-finger nucleic acid-binding protein
MLPMSGNTYSKYLKDMFNPGMHQNMIRKAYINYWHKRPEPRTLDILTRKKIAVRMRHSLPVALNSYFKIGLKQCPDIGDVPDLPASKVPQRVEVQKPMERVGGYFDPVAYSKKYRESNSDKIKKQRGEYYEKNKERVLRSKALWYLNKNKVKKPQKCTIERYGLVYDGEEWTSTMDDCVRTRVRKKVVAVEEKKKVVVARKSKRVKKPSKRALGEGKK